MTEFRTFLPTAGRVRLAGEFTQWADDAIPMRPEGDGWWSLLVDLPQGEHDFNYLVDECKWVADFASFGVEQNCHGVWVSRVYVPNQMPVPIAA
jgi:1,4-alpha-glucan branching enzyme